MVSGAFEIVSGASGGMISTPLRSKKKMDLFEKTPKLSPSVVHTPGLVAIRRSPRFTFSPQTEKSEHNIEKSGSATKSRRSLFTQVNTPSKRPSTVLSIPNPPEPRKKRREAKKRAYYKKVVFDGEEFKVGDDVYVKRREDAESDEDDPEVEECRICFEIGVSLMIECDDCLGGFHLRCLEPPLRKVPEGDWICEFCEAKKLGKKVKLPRTPEGKKLRRTAREKLLSSDLWAARIESLWKEPDGTYWLKCRWYVIPEETIAGRQPHNLRRELYLTNDFSDIEMESVIRHCYVMNPMEFGKANQEGDDVFYCEYEYDVHWRNFKHLAEAADTNNEDESESDEEWKMCSDSDSDSENDLDIHDDTMEKFSSQGASTHELAANSRRGKIFGLHKIGLNKIPEHVRLHKASHLERVKSKLLLAALPKTLPCRTKEMEEITSFIKGAICEDHFLGRCLYIHGVPGTGKTMTVLAVLRNLRVEVDARRMRPYCFVEVNGLKLASPENIYKVIYETLSGHRVGWKKALCILNERFSMGAKIGKEENQPCVLLIDEIDLLLTRNQSVLYNIFDWPTKPNSNLIVIGISNTMDLPEKFLPRISSRMGIQRLCFSPYNYQQLQEIISSRLKGTNAFEDQAIEFASRKVAAMSGDARRALEICCRAAEVADYRHKQLMLSSNLHSPTHSSPEVKLQVGMNDIEAVIHEMFEAPHIKMMKTFSRLSKIMLASMVHELNRNGLGEVTFQKLANTIRSLCSSNKELTLPGCDDLLIVSYKLSECKIILSEEASKQMLQRLQLNYPSDDISFALKDCPEIPWLSKYL